MRVVTGVGDIGPPPWDCSSHKYRTQGLPGRQRAAPSVLSLDSGIYMSGRSLRRADKVGTGYAETMAIVLNCRGMHHKESVVCWLWCWRNFIHLIFYIYEKKCLMGIEKICVEKDDWAIFLYICTKVRCGRRNWWDLILNFLYIWQKLGCGRRKFGTQKFWRQNLSIYSRKSAWWV